MQQKMYVYILIYKCESIGSTPIFPLQSERRGCIKQFGFSTESPAKKLLLQLIRYGFV